MPRAGRRALPRRPHSRRIVPRRRPRPRGAAGIARGRHPLPSAERLRGGRVARRHRRRRLRRRVRKHGTAPSGCGGCCGISGTTRARVIDFEAWRGPLAQRRRGRRAGRVRAARAGRRHDRGRRAAGLARASSWSSTRALAVAVARRAESDRHGAGPRSRARSTRRGTSRCPSCPTASSSPTAAPASRPCVALHRLALAGRHGRALPGSWSEWEQRTDLPREPGLGAPRRRRARSR